MSLSVVGIAFCVCLKCVCDCIEDVLGYFLFEPRCIKLVYGLGTLYNEGWVGTF